MKIENIDIGKIVNVSEIYEVFYHTGWLYVFDVVTKDNKILSYKFDSEKKAKAQKQMLIDKL